MNEKVNCERNEVEEAGGKAYVSISAGFDAAKIGETTRGLATIMTGLKIKNMFDVEYSTQI